MRGHAVVLLWVAVGALLLSAQEPPAQAPQARFRASTDLLLDRTIPPGQPTIIARRVAAAAVEQLGPGDLAAVVSTSGGATQNLTGDRARLLCGPSTDRT